MQFIKRPSSINFKEEGIITSVSDMQLANAFFPIDFNIEFFSNEICTSDEHVLNALSPIDFKEEGKDICLSDEHLTKASFPINSNFDKIETSSSDEHS